MNSVPYKEPRAREFRSSSMTPTSVEVPSSPPSFRFIRYNYSKLRRMTITWVQNNKQSTFSMEHVGTFTSHSGTKKSGFMIWQLINFLTCFTQPTRLKLNRWLVGHGVSDVETFTWLPTSRVWWVRCVWYWTSTTLPQVTWIETFLEEVTDQNTDYPYFRSLSCSCTRTRSLVSCSQYHGEHYWSIEGWIHSQRRNRFDHWEVSWETRSHTHEPGTEGEFEWHTISSITVGHGLVIMSPLMSSTKRNPKFKSGLLLLIPTSSFESQDTCMFL